MTSTTVSPQEDPVGERQAPAIAFAGRIASGKSSLSRTLAHHLGVPRVSFADYVRQRAREERSSDTELPRVVLQRLGAELASDPAQFCELVIGSAPGWQPGRPLVIDGVRHVAILEALRKRLDSPPVLLVFVDSGAARRDLLLRVEGYSDEAIERMAADSTESDLRWELASLADVVLDDAPPENMLDELSTWLRGVWPSAGDLIDRLPDRASELRRNYRAITEDELVRKDPSGAADPTHWHQSGLVLAFHDSAEGVLEFPEFQFGYDTQPYPVLKFLISKFRMARISDESLFDWLVEPNIFLGWDAPADELKRFEDISRAADEFLHSLSGGATRSAEEELLRRRTGRRIFQRWTGIGLEDDPKKAASQLVEASRDRPGWLAAFAVELDSHLLVGQLRRVLDIWGLSDSEASRRFGVTRQALSKWLTRGVPAERLEMVADLAAATDLLVHYLKRDRIPATVRRQATHLGGRSLLDLVSVGDSRGTLEACRAMFDFSAVHR